MKAIVREFLRAGHGVRSNSWVKRISKSVKYTDIFNNPLLVFPEDFTPTGVSRVKSYEKTVEYKDGAVDTTHEDTCYTKLVTDKQYTVKSKSSSNVTKVYTFVKYDNRYLLKTFIYNSSNVYNFDTININGNVLPYNVECKLKDYTTKKFYDVFNNKAYIVQKDTINNHTKSKKVVKYRFDEYGNLTKKSGNTNYPLDIKYCYYSDGTISFKNSSYKNGYNVSEFNKDGYILYNLILSDSDILKNTSWKYDRYNRVITKSEKFCKQNSIVITTKNHKFNDDNTVETIGVEVLKTFIGNSNADNRPIDIQKNYRSIITKTYDSPYLNDGKAKVLSICGIYNKDFKKLVDENYSYVSVSNGDKKVSKYEILNHDTKDVLFTTSYEYNNDGLLVNMVEEKYGSYMNDKFTSVDAYLYKESYKYFEGTDIIESIDSSVE